MTDEEDQDLSDGLGEGLKRVRRSLSAVSKPNFARKYALESSRRDLHNALLCTVLKAQTFENDALFVLPTFYKFFAKFCQNFGKKIANFTKKKN